MQNQQKNTLFYILMTLAMLGWGISWVNIKVLGNYINYDELVFYRYSMTTIAMLPILYFMKLSFKISLRNLILSFIASLVLVIYTVFFYLGTKYGTSGVGGALVTTTIPIITFILLVIFFKKEIFIKDLFALGLGAVGVFTILNIWQLSKEDIFTLANLFFILCAFTWAVITVINTMTKDIHPMIFSFYIYLFAIIISYIFGDFTSGNILELNSTFWYNIIFISVISTTFSTSVYFIGIQHIGTSATSSFLFLVPFFAIVSSYIFLDEPIFLTTVLGTILTIVAIYMINKK